MATVITHSKYAVVESQCYQILMANDWTLAQTCGILANINAESGFNKDAWNESEGAYGLCQWRSSRKSKLFELYGNSPSIRQQLEFIQYEMNTTEKSARDSMKAITVNSREKAIDAALTFASKFERCDSAYYNERKRLGGVYWDTYNGSTLYPPAAPGADLTFKDPTDGGDSSSGVPDYISLTDSTPHAEQASSILSRVAAEGYDYGYLVDMTNGGEFKFYIPEFSESAGARWDDISIPGRSVSIKSYNSTDSRKIAVDLDLYAGAGLYISNDPVSQLHKDANFIKSLEYPDYSTSILAPPPTVCLILGSAISLVGVVSGVDVKHQKPLDEQNRAMYLKISFTVTQIASDPPDWINIRNGQYSIPSTEDSATLEKVDNKSNNPVNLVDDPHGIPSAIIDRYYK